jgi:hypothetical protein
VTAWYDYDNRVASLAQLIIWLSRRVLGLAFLLALASSVALLFLRANYPNRFFIDGLVAKLLSPADRLGFYLGTLVFPHYGTRGQTGTYLIPLFGFVAAFLVWWMLWFAAMKCASWLRASSRNRPEISINS